MDKIKLEKELTELQEQINNMQKKLDKLKQIKSEEKEGKWKPKINKRYYFINDLGTVDWTNWCDDQIDNFRYLIGNIFRTQEEAEFCLEKIKIRSKFKDFIKERSKDLDWGNSNSRQMKYYLYYDNKYKQIEINSCIYAKIQGVIYASDRSILQDAIKEIGEQDVKKYILEVEE